MDQIFPRRREPAFEDSDAYLTLCARHGTAPIARPAGIGEAYVGLPDVPELPPLASLDGLAAAFGGYHGARTPTAELAGVEPGPPTTPQGDDLDDDEAVDYLEAE